jgi:hypothetical protein
MTSHKKTMYTNILLANRNLIKLEPNLTALKIIDLSIGHFKKIKYLLSFRCGTETTVK